MFCLEQKARASVDAFFDLRAAAELACKTEPRFALINASPAQAGEAPFNDSYHLFWRPLPTPLLFNLQFVRYSARSTRGPACVMRATRVFDRNKLSQNIGARRCEGTRKHCAPCCVLCLLGSIYLQAVRAHHELRISFWIVLIVLRMLSLLASQCSMCFGCSSFSFPRVSNKSCATSRCIPTC